MNKARFITFEGGEGVGKSTQIARLCETLRNGGGRVLQTREPGGTVGAEQIRQILKSGDPDKFDGLTETLLFYAARHDHMVKLIRPALEEGKWVVCDRFSDSSYVHQLCSGHVDLDTYQTIRKLTIGDFSPELTLILDMDPVEGLSRSKVRSMSSENEAIDTLRFDRKGLAYHQRVREGYLQLVKDEPERCVLIDASGSPEDVQHRIWKVVAERFTLSE